MMKRKTMPIVRFGYLQLKNNTIKGAVRNDYSFLTAPYKFIYLIVSHFSPSPLDVHPQTWTL